MNPEQQRTYWDNRIVAWDSTIYGKSRPLPWVERLAAPFRGNLTERRDFALAFVQDVVPRRLLEIGCGTGEFFAHLPAAATLERYVGVDISAVAIEQARSRPERTDLRCRPEFLVAATRDLRPSDYLDFDFVLMLGLTPYITGEEFAIAARIMQGKSFLFDYHPAGPSIWNLLHWGYRLVARHPFYCRFTDTEMKQLLRAEGIERFQIVRRHHLAFAQHASSEKR